MALAPCWEDAARNTKWRPSGRKNGVRYSLSCLDGSGSRIFAGCPPAATTRWIAPADEKMITPSLFQLPPATGGGVSQIVCGGPPATSAFLSLRSSKKPIDRLSGDQNACVTTLSGISTCGVTEFSSTASTPRATAPPLLPTIHRPSGEIEIGTCAPKPTVFKTNFTTSGSGDVRKYERADVAATPTTTSAAAASAIQRIRSRCWRAATGAGTPTCDPPSAIHCSCTRRSQAVCRRCFGSLRRQRFSTWSSAGGANGCNVDTGSGSTDWIDAI